MWPRAAGLNPILESVLVAICNAGFNMNISALCPRSVYIYAVLLLLLIKWATAIGLSNDSTLCFLRGSSESSYIMIFNFSMLMVNSPLVLSLSRSLSLCCVCLHIISLD